VRFYCKPIYFGKSQKKQTAYVVLLSLRFCAYFSLQTLKTMIKGVARGGPGSPAPHQSNVALHC